MKSMRRQLIFALLAGVLLVAWAVGTGLYFFVKRELTYQFDSTLTARARALTATVRSFDQNVQMSASPEIMAEFSRARRPEYFQIWDADGSVFWKSPSLGSATLSLTAPVSDRQVSRDLLLPDGHQGRAVFLRFHPLPSDPDDAPPAGSPRDKASMVLVLARNRNPVDEPLDVVLWSLLGAAAALAVGVVLVVAVTVRRSLRPLARVADEATRINADSLEYRFGISDLPVELAPICMRLNDLLERLDAAFSRERRFTSDVAHELRTPIAELRSLSEVAIRWPGDSASAAGNFRDALEISRHMEKMVTALMALARCESGKQSAELEAVNLEQAVTAVWKPLKSQAQAQNLSFDFAIPPVAVVRSDAALLASIVSNFLSNSVQYATPGTKVSVGAQRHDSCWILRVANFTDALSPADLPHLYEPFWRKDAARSPDDHSGLGLALVKAYAEVLSAKIDASLGADHLFAISIELPAAAELSQGTGSTNSAWVNPAADENALTTS